MDPLVRNGNARERICYKYFSNVNTDSQLG